MSKLVIIDDDPVHHYLMRYTLHDYDDIGMITYAMDESLVLDYIEENRYMPDKLPDIILLGLNRPKFTGWKFLEGLHKIYPSLEKEIRVYILTSSFRPIDRLRSRKFPFIRSYLSKPLDGVVLNRLRCEELC